MARLSTLLLLLATGAGCANLPDVSDALNPFVDRPIVADATNPAVEMACVWQPGEGPGGYGVPARGFAGQIFFFTSRDAEPVLVNGSVRIYLFANRGTPEDRAKPLKQFDFGPEAWSAHATMASLGAGYSVFVPYPETEAYQVRCELRARFTPSDGGPPVWSEGVMMVLDGPPRPGDEPAWWSNVNRAASPPTVANYEINHERGTLAQLNGSDKTREQPVEPLRTATIPLGPIRPVSFQTPGETSRPRSASQPRQRPGARPSPSSDSEPAASRVHPLQSGTSFQTESHLLTTSPARKPAAPHPFARQNETDTSPQADQSPPTRFQLTPASSSPMKSNDPSTDAPHPLAG